MELGKVVDLVNEETLGFDKAEYYKEPQQEKILRASLRSNVEKYLDQDNVVICDSLNYIKGFRYELYCLARNASTTLTVVFCDTDPESAAKLNAEREQPFPSDLFEDYCGRLERPNAANRWDSPLIHLYLEDETPLDKIQQAVLDGKKPKDPVVTKVHSVPDTNFAYLLDKTCNDINSFIIDKQGDYLQGAMVPVDGCSKQLKLYKTFSPIDLKLMKKEFVNLTKLHPPSHLKDLPNIYLAYINSSEEQEEDY